MICGMSFYQVCWYFLIYSLIGWSVEVIFHAVSLGKVINRGFLNGPVCPVYGFGVLSVFAMVNTLEAAGHEMNSLMVFIFGVVLATLVELIAGWLMDVCFHARWWDYSDRPLNLNGYICVEFSLIWGFAILLVVRVFQAFVEKHVEQAPSSVLGWILLAVFYAAFLADFIVTVAIIQGLNKKLKQLDELRADMRIASDKMSEFLATKTIDTAQRVEEGKVQATLAKYELMDAGEEKVEKTMELMREKKASLQKEIDRLSESITRHSFIGQGRLLKAFPGMKHRDYSEVVQELKNKFLNKEK